jgi:hypothetical protein
MRWRAVPLRHQDWERRFAGFPFPCCLSSQPNNSRAWGADIFLTFLTANSTVLIQYTLPGKLVCGKRVYPHLATNIFILTQKSLMQAAIHGNNLSGRFAQTLRNQKKACFRPKSK